jgi:hypothetical protein
MTADNFDRTLRAYQKRKPFKPFTVALVNGDRLQVDHPEVLVLRAGVAVYIAPAGPITIFDHEGVNQVIGEPLKKPN